MRMFVLFCFLSASLASFAQKGGYRQTEYKIEFKKKEDGLYKKRKKSRTRTSYRLFDQAHNMVEFGEYGLEYCKSGHSLGDKRIRDSLGVTSITVYRVQDFNRLNKITRCTYDSSELKRSEIEIDFQNQDTIRRFFDYSRRGLIRERTISTKDTEEARYDTIGRLIEEMWLSNGAVKRRNYHYSNKGKLIKVEDENGKEIALAHIPTYDSIGRLIEELSLRDSKLELRTVHKYDYDRHTLFNYDAGGELISLEDSVGMHYHGKVLYYDAKYRFESFTREWEEDWWGRIKFVRYYNEDMHLTDVTEYKYKKL